MVSTLKNKSINKLTDCLFLDIDSCVTRKNGIVLFITMHFNEHVINHSLGNVSVALRGGDLRLGLENISFIRHDQYGSLPLSVMKKSIRDTGELDRRGKESISKPSSSVELGLSSTKAKLSSSHEDKTALAREATTKASDEVSYQTWQIHALDGPTPGWRFRLKTNEPYLEGSILRERFCECHLDQKPGEIIVRFHVDQRFIRMEVLTGMLLSKGIYALLSPKKRKIFNLWLWKNVVKPHFFPCLSEAKIQYV